MFVGLSTVRSEERGKRAELALASDQQVEEPRPADRV